MLSTSRHHGGGPCRQLSADPLGSLEEVVGVEEFASVRSPASPPRISRATKLGFPSRSVLVACAVSGVARQRHGGLELKNSARSPRLRRSISPQRALPFLGGSSRGERCRASSGSVRLEDTASRGFGARRIEGPPGRRRGGAAGACPWPGCSAARREACSRVRRRREEGCPTSGCT